MNKIVRAIAVWILRVCLCVGLVRGLCWIAGRVA